MIIVCKERQQELADYISEHAGGTYTVDAGYFFGLERNGKLAAVVAATDYKVRSIGFHIAATGMLSIEFLKYCFDYAFNFLGVNRIVTTVDSTNLKSMRFSERVGFILEHSIKDASREGDLNIMTMTRKQCYLLDK